MATTLTRAPTIDRRSQWNPVAIGAFEARLPRRLGPLQTLRCTFEVSAAWNICSNHKHFLFTEPESTVRLGWLPVAGQFVEDHASPAGASSVTGGRI